MTAFPVKPFFLFLFFCSAFKRSQKNHFHCKGFFFFFRRGLSCLSHTVKIILRKTDERAGTSRQFLKKAFLSSCCHRSLPVGFCTVCTRCSQQLQGTESENGTVCPDPGSERDRQSAALRLKGATEVGEVEGREWGVHRQTYSYDKIRKGGTNKTKRQKGAEAFFPRRRMYSHRRRFTIGS